MQEAMPCPHILFVGRLRSFFPSNFCLLCSLTCGHSAKKQTRCTKCELSAANRLRRLTDRADNSAVFFFLLSLGDVLGHGGVRELFKTGRARCHFFICRWLGSFQRLQWP